MKFCCFCSLGWRPNGGRFRGPGWRGWRQSSQQAASSEASVRPVPDQNRAASFIQAVVRGNKVRAAIKALMAQKQSQREEEQIREKYEHETPQEHKQSEDAALKIQSIFRGHHSREEVAELRVEVRTTTRATTRTKSINEREVLRQINDYSVSALLGKGSFGIVYKAKHAPTKQVRAIKVLTRSVLRRKRMGKGTAYDSVLREIVVMKHIWHPNVVRLFEVIDDPEHDELYLVMEFVDGGDLLEPIKKKKFTNEDTLRRWMRDSVMGLEHLHNSGVCHRDIKPENILWDKKAKRAKLADFGVSTLCGQGRAGDYVKASHGTPLFFAPEMSGDDKTGARVYSGKAADCWALGVCLYMWMYLKAPFEAPTVHMLLELIRESEVVYPTHVYKASDSLMELLRGLLQQKPIQRLRVKDMRRDNFITNLGEEELPPDPNITAGQVARDELKSAISTVVASLRSSSIVVRDSSEAKSLRARITGADGEGLARFSNVGGLGDLQAMDPLDSVEEASMVSVEEESVVEPIEYEDSIVQAPKREPAPEVIFEDPLEC